MAQHRKNGGSNYIDVGAWLQWIAIAILISLVVKMTACAPRASLSAAPATATSN